jgi:hypothetical protein
VATHIDQTARVVEGLDDVVLVGAATEGWWSAESPTAFPSASTRWPTWTPHGRVRDEPGWEVPAVDSRHNVVRDVPERLAEVLLDAARR